MKVFPIRIDESVLKQVQARAKKEGRGVAEIVRQLLSEYLEKKNED